MKAFGLIMVALLVVLLLALSTIGFTVSSTEMAIVMTFGKATRTIDGTAEGAGLHWKWPYPFQERVVYDASLQVFEDPFTQISTADRKQILVSFYCVWRIEEPLKFHSNFDAPRDGQRRIRDLVSEARGDVLGAQELSDLLNVDPQRMKLTEIEADIRDRVSDSARGYGVKIVRVGIKAIGLPESVTENVIQAMIKDRGRETQKYRSAGEAQAAAIRARANAAADKIREFAKRKASDIRAEGDRAAAEIYRTFDRNEELAMFLRALESLRTVLGQRTTIVLDNKVFNPLRLFTHGPEAELSPPTTRPESDGGSD